MRGVLLVKGTPPETEAWVRRGVVAAHVVPVGTWVGVCPAEARTRAPEPYGEVIPALAGHPLRRSQRPGIGFFVTRDDTGERGLLTLQSGRVRARTSWLAWSPARGTHTLPPLPSPSIADLATAAGRPGAKGRVLDALRDRRTSVDEWLTGVMLALGLPAVDLILGAPRGVPVTEPEEKSVETFASLTADDLREDTSS
ncbi:MAG: hypothetical protein ABR616_06195 [Dermatophilaceae bacterium]|nr:hypothetical protein [Intrasporangiaceae bacterium]